MTDSFEFVTWDKYIRVKNVTTFVTPAIIRSNLSHVWCLYFFWIFHIYLMCDKSERIHHKQVFVTRTYLSEVCRFLWNLECRYITLPSALHLPTCMFVKTWAGSCWHKGRWFYFDQSWTDSLDISCSKHIFTSYVVYVVSMLNKLFDWPCYGLRNRAKICRIVPREKSLNEIFWEHKFVSW